MGEILRAEGISKTYHTGMVEVHALKKCDITIRKGEFTAIIGKSGAGKSTLLRIIGSLDKIPEYTAYENIVLPVVLDNQDIDEDDVNDLLESLQIEHCRDKFPEQMSGGEQQRVAIARALIMHPAVVYADEPTGNLDAESAENVAAMLSLAASKYKQTIVMVTHDKQMAEYADRIFNIVDGHVRTDVGE